MDETLSVITIEKVSNGFIVYENLGTENNSRSIAHTISERLVFNTKDQLKKYIDKNL